MLSIVLSNGKQPDINEINKVGYLLRTTAVYGSGKFGLSDFYKILKQLLNLTNHLELKCLQFIS